MLLDPQALINWSLAEIAEGRPLVVLSTTQLALARGAGGDDDTYIPGNARERVYMRLKTTVKETDINIKADYDFDEGVNK
jgi:hypothetical protein